MPKILLPAIKGAWLRKDGAVLTGAGQSNDAPIGYDSATGAFHRYVVAFRNLDVAGLPVVKVRGAKLFGRNDTPHRLTRGATPKGKIRRVTAAFTPNSSSEPSTSGLVWPGPATATAGSDNVSTPTLATADNAWNDGVDITDLFCNALPTTVKRPNGTDCGGATFYGLMLAGFGDTWAASPPTYSGANNTEFWSAETTSEMYIEVTYDDRHPPTGTKNLVAFGSPVYQGDRFPGDRIVPAPTPKNTWPLGDEAGHVLVATPSGTDFWISGTIDSPDAAASIFFVEVEVYNAAGGGVRNYVGWYGAGAKSFNIHLGVNTPDWTDPPFVPGASYRYRVRVQDDTLTTAPWSTIVDHQVTVDKKPTLTNPHISAGVVPTFNGTNGVGTITAARVLVTLTTASDTTIKWDSDKVSGLSGNTFSLVYTGLTLDPDVPVTVEMWLWDALDVMSPSSGKVTFIPQAFTGPSAMSPIDTSVKLDTLTPNLTIGHASAFDGIEFRLYRFIRGAWAMVGDSGVSANASTTSRAVAVPAGVFEPGETGGWDAAIRPTGTGILGPFSPIYSIYFNATPSEPGPVTCTTAGSVYFAGLGGLVIPSLTPTFVFPFNDVDVEKYDWGTTEFWTRREIELYHWNGTGWDPVAGSPFIITSGITDTWTVPGGGLLGLGNVYYVRARYDDSAGFRSPWSSPVSFRPSVLPTATVVSPAIGATTADPTTPLTYNYASAVATPQASQRVQVYDVTAGANDLLWDSGVTGLPQPVVPAYILSSGLSIRADLAVTDTDGLVGYATYTFSTSFTKPAALANLVLAPDTDASAVVLTVDASVDPYIYEYWWYRRPSSGTGAGDMTLIARTTLPTYTDYEANQGVPLAYLVSQNTGAIDVGESDAIQDTTLLPMIFVEHVYPGDPTHTFELPFASGLRKSEPFSEGIFDPLPGVGVDPQPPIVRSGRARGARLALTIQITPDDLAIIDRLEEVRTLYRTGFPYSVLKDGQGAVWRCRLGEIGVDYADHGWRSVTVQATQVSG